TPEQIKLANEMNNQNICIVKHLETCHNLHIIVEMSDGNNCVTVEVLNLHDNIVKVIKNNKILLNKESDDSKFYGTFTSREQLSFDNIYDYAKNADLSNIIDLIKMQKDFNYAIAVEGMKGNYGIAIGITNINHYPDNIYTKMKAYALAASEARMCGCKLPVVTNSGSGNQGIGASVPLILYAKYNKISDEDLDRALVFSNLLTIYQKTFIGRLSAFCGAISATCGAVCGLAFLQNYDKQVLRNVIINTLANDIGVICDGAKSSCAAKIGCGFDAAINAYFLAIDGKRYPDKCGIINEDVDITIKNVGRMASKGMQDTDREILQIMLEN
ncbi:MAG: L-serine ammonia-lyase, iron-sulfur-dependent, subunit alpha, partial [Clostridia bacterium]